MLGALWLALLGVLVILIAIGIVVIVMMARNKARTPSRYAPPGSVPGEPPRAESDPRDGQAPPSSGV